jgi:predicted amidohydrolase YtcJ
MLDGKTIGGTAMRAPEQLPSRLQALRLYSEGSAWFAFEETRRGSLAPGKLADLAVLSNDYLTVPVEEIGSIRSLLTMVGGRVVHADQSFTRQRDKTPD